MRGWTIAALMVAGAALTAPSPATAQTRIEMWSHTEGSLTTRDRRRSGRFVDTYRFRGERGQQVVVELESDDFDTTLRLEGHGLSEANDDGHPDTTDSRIEVTLPRTGIYTVAVSSFDRGATGAYRLGLAGPPPEPPCQPPYFGDGNGGCVAPPAPAPQPAPPPPPHAAPGEAPGATELRRFYLLPGQQYRPAAGNLPFGVVLLRQGERDRNRALCESFVSGIASGRDPNPSGRHIIATYWLLTSDVGPSGETNCDTLLASYDYARAQQIMTDYGSRGGGPTLLALQLPQNPGGQATVVLLDMSRRSTEDIGRLMRTWYDAIASGQLAEPRRERGGGGLLGWVEDRLEDVGEAVGRGVCDLFGGREPTGREVRYVDRALGISGLIRTVVQGVSIVSIGVEFVAGLACGSDSPAGTGARGPFTLPPPGGAAGQPPRQAGTPPLTLPHSWSGTLASGDAVFGNGAHHDDYVIALAANQRIQIDLRSTDFDTQLFLYRDGDSTHLAQDDDGGDETDSRITFTAPASGNYRIRASSYAGGATGSYRLSVTSPN